MKKILFSVLIALFVLPAFTPLMPHDGIHALHDHHSVQTHAHVHDHAAQGSDDKKTQVSDHHPIRFDAVSYFNDYLHVDLQNSEKIILKAPAPGSQNVKFTTFAAFVSAQRYQRNSVQSRAPPNWQRLKPKNTPVYLSTQRLRI
jgi:hypothetical protein|tara:strand:- start:952 stop:1383 length:432 start_codon:yes stop_codon:yes gene_type:complete